MPNGYHCSEHSAGFRVSIPKQADLACDAVHLVSPAADRTPDPRGCSRPSSHPPTQSVPLPAPPPRNLGGSSALALGWAEKFAFGGPRCRADLTSPTLTYSNRHTSLAVRVLSRAPPSACSLPIANGQRCRKEPRK
jgi:hypothetical protein